MTAAAPTAAQARPSEGAPPRFGEESWTAYAAWAADELGRSLSFDGSVYRLSPLEVIEEAPKPSESSLRRGWLRRRPERQPPEEHPPEAIVVHTPAEVIAALSGLLREREAPPNAKPLAQPEAVHELTQRLFEAYQLDGGKAHIAGCRFEESPLVRLSATTAGPDGSLAMRHLLFDELGAPIDWETAQQLGLDRVGPMSNHGPRLEPGRRARMLESASRAASRFDSSDDEEDYLVTIVWAKRAAGRLRFDFGEESVDAAFEGWAQLLEAPPVVCPLTGRETFHLGTIEGGAIAAAEEIEPCAVSGARHLRRDLGRCAATGQLVEKDRLGHCPVTGVSVLADELTPCPKCGQRVAPATLMSNDCQGCHKTAPVSAKDSRLVALREKHPDLLGAGRGWAIAETKTSYVLERAGWFRRRVYTFEKESLETTHEAEASRFGSAWRLG